MSRRPGTGWPRPPARSRHSGGTGELGPFPAEITSGQRTGDHWLGLGKDNRIHQWDTADKKVLRSFGGGKRVYAWAVSPMGAWLFVGGEAGDQLWNLKTGEEVADVFKARPGYVSRGVFMADDRLLVGNNSGVHKVLEIPSGKELLRFKNEGVVALERFNAEVAVMHRDGNARRRAVFEGVDLSAKNVGLELRHGKSPGWRAAVGVERGSTPGRPSGAGRPALGPQRATTADGTRQQSVTFFGFVASHCRVQPGARVSPGSVGGGE